MFTIKQKEAIERLLESCKEIIETRRENFSREEELYSCNEFEDARTQLYIAASDTGSVGGIIYALSALGYDSENYREVYKMHTDNQKITKKYYSQEVVEDLDIYI